MCNFQQFSSIIYYFKYYALYLFGGGRSLNGRNCISIVPHDRYVDGLDYCFDIIKSFRENNIYAMIANMLFLFLGRFFRQYFLPRKLLGVELSKVGYFAKKIKCGCATKFSNVLGEYAF